MLTMHVSTLLALLGTALMAIVIFAPAPTTASTVRPAEVYSPLPSDAFTASVVLPLPERVPCAPAWPMLVDRSAANCDVEARLELVGALAAVRAPWADAILHRALDEEPDARVRATISAARTP